MSWPTVTFGEIFTFLPKSKLQASCGVDKGLHKFFTSSSVQKKWIDDATFNTQALVFGTGGNASIHYVEGMFSTSTDCLVAQLKDASNVYLKYVYHFLSSNIHLLQEGFKGAGLKHISKTYIENLKIPLPTLVEQKHITEILNKSEVIKVQREQAIAKLDELAKSAFLEMFGDPIINQKNHSKMLLSQLCTRIQIGPFGTQLHEEDYVDNGIPVINPTHIVKGEIKPAESLTITELKHSELAQYHLEKGDLIIGRRGEMGRCAVVTEKEQGWMCGTGSLFLRLNTSIINPYYLQYVLSSQSMRKHLESVAQGVTMSNLNKDIIGGLAIQVPSISKQIRFNQIKDRNAVLLSDFKRSLYQINEMIASLQHQAFTTGFNA
jgi:type I restriction enzyme, S subunit